MQPDGSVVLRTPDEWLALKHPNLTVYDPDGWRGSSGRPWIDPITEGEFDQRLPYCTVGGSPTGGMFGRGSDAA